MKKITRINASKTVGIEAVPVRIETVVSEGIGIHLIGLADESTKESLLRVVTALCTIGVSIPGKKTIINIAPADNKKSLNGCDLAIALSVMDATGQVSLPHPEHWLVIGELGLDASVLTVPGCVEAVTLAGKMHIQGCIVPKGNEEEVAPLADGVPVFAVSTLQEAIDVIRGKTKENRVKTTPST